MRRVGGVLLALVVGCGGPSITIGGEAQWYGADGNPVPPAVVSVAPGPADCGWQSAAFLRVSWPPGTTIAGEVPERRLYVRDPDAVLPASRLDAPYGLFASLPRGAAYTGLHTDDFQLWIADDSDIYVYVVYGSRVEAWPRTDPELDC